MKRSALLAPLPCVALALIFTGVACERQQPPRQASFSVGNTDARVEVAANHTDQQSTLISTARRNFNSVWQEFNPTNRAGEISKINQMGSEYRLQISFNTFRGLDLADYYSRLTDGAYDLTLDPLREAWGINAAPPDEPPSEEEIEALRSVVGPDHIQLSEQGAISILTPGTRVTPGDLPYAYGTDLATLDMRNRELGPALLSWGNFSRALSRHGDDFNARVPLPNPFSKTNSIGSVELSPDAALASANLYKDSTTIAGIRYGGILDPRTGHPATGTVFVAVRGPTCTMAHVLAQSLVVLGREKGEEVLKRFPDCEVLLIPDRRPLELWLTPGFAEHFQVNTALTANVKTWAIQRDEPDADTGGSEQEPE